MILRSAFALGVLATGLVAYTGDSQAQNYPPQNYPPYGAQACAFYPRWEFIPVRSWRMAPRIGKPSPI